MRSSGSSSGESVSGSESEEEEVVVVVGGQRGQRGGDGVDKGEWKGVKRSALPSRETDALLASECDTATTEEWESGEEDAELDGVEEDASYTKHRLWIVGMVLIISGSFADFAALGFAEQSIVAPLGSLTLVANAFFAPLLLGERITLRDILSTLTIIVGCVIAVAFASHNDRAYSVNELFSFYTRSRFGIYAAVVLIMIASLWALIKHMDSVRLEGDDQAYTRVRGYHRFCYASLAGLVGAQNMLFAKSTSELVVGTIGGRFVMFVYFESYLILLCLGCTIFLQLKWLNNALALFDALYVVPVFQSFWIVGSVVGGLVFFGEYESMSATSAVVFPIGITLVIIGVYFLSQRGVSTTDVDIGYSTPLLEEVTRLFGYQAAASPLSQQRQQQERLARERRRQRRRDSRVIDNRIGFTGMGPPAVFTPSMMGRCSVVYTTGPRRKATVRRSKIEIIGPHYQSTSPSPQPRVQQYQSHSRRGGVGLATGSPPSYGGVDSAAPRERLSSTSDASVSLADSPDTRSVDPVTGSFIDESDLV